MVLRPSHDANLHSQKGPLDVALARRLCQEGLVAGGRKQRGRNVKPCTALCASRSCILHSPGMFVGFCGWSAFDRVARRRSIAKFALGRQISVICPL